MSNFYLAGRDCPELTESNLRELIRLCDIDDRSYVLVHRNLRCCGSEVALHVIALCEGLLDNPNLPLALLDNPTLFHFFLPRYDGKPKWGDLNPVEQLQRYVKFVKYVYNSCEFGKHNGKATHNYANYWRYIPKHIMRRMNRPHHDVGYDEKFTNRMRRRCVEKWVRCGAKIEIKRGLEEYNETVY